MSSRTYRPGFHRSKFFGIINTVLAGRVYALHGAGGKELEQVSANSLAEALAIAREHWGNGCRAVLLHSGDFDYKGRTMKVRAGRIAT